ncbi:molybdopterin molybdotransferase MoeA [Lentzea sp. BCCO 10_0061]|uniref:Molybdopterin molybdenumtransferase n=1 Tax=Lentzea sokolovensis TaxID=3095429 RepID=A0ABU4VD88_9PSEU|nr:molybdopterin molybdotransferase MoeA [Lentzea sp. BCCO 10_0061]MDX8148951.1 molybdopterin molybdotransferase MoeA [Lentzea sp. BCCO 10_0061]
MNMPWTLARQTARDAAKPLDATELALPDALGLALASAVRALTSQPTCDTSAMDGYAVAGPGPWTVVGRVAAGDPVPALALRPGEAFGVATGAPVPDGSESVLPVERCSTDGTQLREDHTAPDERGRRNDPTPRRHNGPAPANRHDHPARATGSHQPEPSPPSDRTLRWEADPSGNRAARRDGTPLGSHEASPPDDHHEPPPLGRHIRRRGEDWSAGDELIPAGSLISPAVVGLAAAAGHDTLLAHRRPRVAVIVTGDELLHTGPPRPGRVRDAIGPMLPGLLTRADLIGTTHLRDDASALAEALTSDQADVLVTCGATSVGPADHLRTVLSGLDAEILVSGVACRPGHPMLLAVLPDGRCVVGLPGNPFAALAAVLTLLHPLLDTLGGHTTRPPITAWLGDVPAHPRDTRLIPVTRSGNTAVPVGHDRPGSLWGAALADALAVVPPGHQGGEVELLA